MAAASGRASAGGRGGASWPPDSGRRERLGLATERPLERRPPPQPPAGESQRASPLPKMSKLCGASSSGELRGKRSLTRLGLAKGRAAPPEAGGVGGAGRPGGGAAPPEVGGAMPGKPGWAGPPGAEVGEAASVRATAGTGKRLVALGGRGLGAGWAELKPGQPAGLIGPS